MTNSGIDFTDKYSFLTRGRSWSAFQGTCCFCSAGNQPY